MDMIKTDFLKLTVVNSTANSLGLINVSYMIELKDGSQENYKVVLGR